MGIRKQLLALALGVALPLTLAGVVALWGLWTASRRQLDHSVERRAELAATALGRWVDAQQERLTTIARYAVEQPRPPTAAGGLLFTATGLYWIDVRVLDAEGRTRLAEPADAEPLPAELVGELVGEVRRRRTWAAVADLQTRGVERPLLALGSPIDESVLLARVDGAVVRDFFRNVEMSQGEVLAVFDARGRTLYRSETARGEKALTAANGAPLVSALGSAPTAVVETTSPIDKVRRIYGLARAGADGFVVVVGTPSGVLHEPARRQLIGYASFSLLTLLSAAGVAALIARRIVHPVGRLHAAVQAFGAGDTRARAPVGDAGEIGELGRAFNRMAAQTEEREKRLAELDRLKSEFIGGVSHELRTPLTTIKTLTHVMLRGEHTEVERREHVKTIAAECDREINLVVNLLNLSRIEADAFVVAAEPVDVAEVVRACLLASRAAADGRGQELRADLPPGLPSVKADYTALRRVLCDLIDSAVKYTPPGGRIAVSARPEGDGAAVSVTDTGPGIHPEDLPHIFEKFYRGRGAQTIGEADGGSAADDEQVGGEVPGIGVGLYLARRVVELMNGRIEVESEPGHGSRFTVHLPVWRDEEAEKG